MKQTLVKRERKILALGGGVLLLVAAVLLAVFARPDTKERPFLYDPAAAAHPQTGLSIQTEISYGRPDAVAVSYPVTGNAAVDQELAALVKEEKKRYEAAGEGQDPSYRELNLSYELTRFNPSLVSVCFSAVSDGPEDHRLLTRTYDLNTGASLELRDFFLPESDYLQRLSDYAIERLRQENPSKTSWSQEQWQQLAGPEKIDCFVLDGEMLCLYFPQEDGETLQARIPLRLLHSVSLFAFPDTSDFQKEGPPNPPLAPERDTVPVSPDAKKVALLFCDGPFADTTGEILDQLKSHGARATFCPLGNRVPYQPQLVRRMALEGHAVCNHTDSHKKLETLSPGDVSTQLKKANAALSSVTGDSPMLICPPYEAVGAKVKTLDGMQVVLPDLQPADWRAEDGRSLADEILASVYDGCIIQLHDRFPATAEAVRLLLEELPGQGYTFVTVEDLME